MDKMISHANTPLESVSHNIPTSLGSSNEQTYEHKSLVSSGMVCQLEITISLPTNYFALPALVVRPHDVDVPVRAVLFVGVASPLLVAAPLGLHSIHS